MCCLLTFLSFPLVRFGSTFYALNNKGNGHNFSSELDLHYRPCTKETPTMAGHKLCAAPCADLLEFGLGASSCYSWGVTAVDDTFSGQNLSKHGL